MTDGRPSFPPLSPEEAAQRATEAGMPALLARPNVFRVLLHHPPVAAIFTQLVQAVVLDSSLDPRLREMAIMRAAWLRGATYEWASHYGLSLRAGMSEDDVVAIRSGPSAPNFTPVERAVLTLVDEVVKVGRASPEVLRAARDAVESDAAYLELLTIPGAYAALASLLDALAVPLDEGTTPWPPDGNGPT